MLRKSFYIMELKQLTQKLYIEVKKDLISDCRDKVCMGKEYILLMNLHILFLGILIRNLEEMIIKWFINFFMLKYLLGIHTKLILIIHF